MTQDVTMQKRTFSPSVRQSFWQVFEQVKIQTELSVISAQKNNRICTELCKIITEVLMLAPDVLIRINGEQLSAELVQEIYLSLELEHLTFVQDKFESITYEIKSKKAYLRTALYNSVFEIDSHYTNLVSVNSSKEAAP